MIGRLTRLLRFKLRASGIEAVVRIGLFLTVVGFTHCCGSLMDLFRSTAERQRRRARRARHSIRRGVRLLGVLKGAFAKAGQFAASRPDVLPESLCAELSALRDRVPPLAFSEIQRSVENELGEPLHALFSRFDPEPLGAASIAQVHRAALLDGREVAVKVQYPWLRASIRSDLVLLRMIARLGARLRGRMLPDRQRFFDEFARGLAEELDFVREAEVANAIASNLAGEPQIVVPAIIASHSGKRVMTMEYHEAVRIDDLDALSRRGVAPRAVLKIVARAYAKQIFVDGVFHADPHPGNLFVIDEPAEGPGQESPRVLFVDFGLSKRLEPGLRSEMRLGIYAILQQDVDAFVDRMDGMGMIESGARPGIRAAVARMFERIGESRGTAGALALSGPAALSLKDQAKVLLRETSGLQLPNDLLLYAKTLSYLVALGQELDPEVDLVRLSTPYLLRFLSGPVTAQRSAAR